MEKINAPPHYYYLCNCACGCETSIGPVRKRLSPYLTDVICGDCGEGTHLPGYDEGEENYNFVVDRFKGVIK